MQSDNKDNRRLHGTRHAWRLVPLTALFGPLVLALACADKCKGIPGQKTDDARRIIGRWQSPPKGWRKTEWGPMKFILEFKPSGRLEWNVMSNPLGLKSDEPGDVLSSGNGTYRISGHTLTMDMEGDIQSVQFEFNDDRLILTSTPDPRGGVKKVDEYVRDDVGKDAEHPSVPKAKKRIPGTQ